MESILNFLQSIPDSPSGVLDFVTGLLLTHGYLVIFLGAALDNFGLPSSGDIVLFAGGFFANNGQAALPLVMLCGFLGALVSDNSVYWIGRVGGRPLISRILKIRLLHFEAHGGKTVFVGRFGPGLRSMTPLFAGVTRMKYYRFVPYNVAAGLVWAVVYSLIGYVFGQYWGELLAVAKSFGFSVVALVVLVVVAFVLRRRYRRKKGA
jgi:membrane-associated protein